MSQGWSLKKIQHEAHRREWAGFGDLSAYHPLRDGPREQDWVWAVDHMRARMEITDGQTKAARKFYWAQQALRGDVEKREMPRVDCAGQGDASVYEKAAKIYYPALAFVTAHPELTPFREATFDRLFAVRQPTLEEIRVARPRGAVGRGRMNQREVKDRIRWCLEALANHFDGLGYPEEAAVNEKRIGVGEGWTRVGHIGDFGHTRVAELQAQGHQVFVSPYGSIFSRDPNILSVFEPLDSAPQIVPRNL
jgi:hypothetical protein